MDVSGVGSTQAAVKLQKSSTDQQKAVIGKIFEGIEEADAQSREFHQTGHQLNIKA